MPKITRQIDLGEAEGSRYLYELTLESKTVLAHTVLQGESKDNVEVAIGEVVRQLRTEVSKDIIKRQNRKLPL